jgi:hypothetical protein
MADGFCFKDIDGMVLTLPQTRQPYGRLLVIHCKSAYDNARKNMNVFGLTMDNLSDGCCRVQELLDASLEDDSDTKSKVLHWLESSNINLTTTPQSSTLFNTKTSKVIPIYKFPR